MCDNSAPPNCDTADDGAEFSVVSSLAHNSVATDLLLETNMHNQSSFPSDVGDMPQITEGRSLVCTNEIDMSDTSQNLPIDEDYCNDVHQARSECSSSSVKLPMHVHQAPSGSEFALGVQDEQLQLGSELPEELFDDDALNPLESLPPILLTNEDALPSRTANSESCIVSDRMESGEPSVDREQNESNAMNLEETNLVKEDSRWKENNAIIESDSPVIEQYQQPESNNEQVQLRLDEPTESSTAPTSCEADAAGDSANSGEANSASGVQEQDLFVQQSDVERTAAFSDEAPAIEANNPIQSIDTDTVVESHPIAEHQSIQSSETQFSKPIEEDEALAVNVAEDFVEPPQLLEAEAGIQATAVSSTEESAAVLEAVESTSRVEEVITALDSESTPTSQLPIPDFESELLGTAEHSEVGLIPAQSESVSVSAAQELEAVLPELSEAEEAGPAPIPEPDLVPATEPELQLEAALDQVSELTSVIESVAASSPVPDQTTSAAVVETPSLLSYGDQEPAIETTAAVADEQPAQSQADLPLLRNEEEEDEHQQQQQQEKQEESHDITTEVQSAEVPTVTQAEIEETPATSVPADVADERPTMPVDAPSECAAESPLRPQIANEPLPEQPVVELKPQSPSDATTTANKTETETETEAELAEKAADEQEWRATLSSIVLDTARVCGPVMCSLDDVFSDVREQAEAYYDEVVRTTQQQQQQQQEQQQQQQQQQQQDETVATAGEAEAQVLVTQINAICADIITNRRRYKLGELPYMSIDDQQLVNATFDVVLPRADKMRTEARIAAAVTRLANDTTSALLNELFSSDAVKPRRPSKKKKPADAENGAAEKHDDDAGSDHVVSSAPPPEKKRRSDADAKRRARKAKTQPDGSDKQAGKTLGQIPAQNASASLQPAQFAQSDAFGAQSFDGGSSVYAQHSAAQSQDQQFAFPSAQPQAQTAPATGKSKKRPAKPKETTEQSTKKEPSQAVGAPAKKRSRKKKADGDAETSQNEPQQPAAKSITSPAANKVVVPSRIDDSDRPASKRSKKKNKKDVNPCPMDLPPELPIILNAVEPPPPETSAKKKRPRKKKGADADAPAANAVDVGKILEMAMPSGIVLDENGDVKVTGRTSEEPPAADTKKRRSGGGKKRTKKADKESSDQQPAEANQSASVNFGSQQSYNQNQASRMAEYDYNLHVAQQQQQQSSSGQRQILSKERGNRSGVGAPELVSGVMEPAEPTRLTGKKRGAQAAASLSSMTSGSPQKAVANAASPSTASTSAQARDIIDEYLEDLSHLQDKERMQQAATHQLVTVGSAQPPPVAPGAPDVNAAPAVTQNVPPANPVSIQQQVVAGGSAPPIAAVPQQPAGSTMQLFTLWPGGAVIETPADSALAAIAAYNDLYAQQRPGGAVQPQRVAMNMNMPVAQQTAVAQPSLNVVSPAGIPSGVAQPTPSGIQLAQMPAAVRTAQQQPAAYYDPYAYTAANRFYTTAYGCDPTLLAVATRLHPGAAYAYDAAYLMATLNAAGVAGATNQPAQPEGATDAQKPADANGGNDHLRSLTALSSKYAPTTPSQQGVAVAMVQPQQQAVAQSPQRVSTSSQPTSVSTAQNDPYRMATDLYSQMSNQNAAYLYTTAAARGDPLAAAYAGLAGQRLAAAAAVLNATANSNSGASTAVTQPQAITSAASSSGTTQPPNANAASVSLNLNLNLNQTGCGVTGAPLSVTAGSNTQPTPLDSAAHFLSPSGANSYLPPGAAQLGNGAVPSGAVFGGPPGTAGGAVNGAGQQYAFAAYPAQAAAAYMQAAAVAGQKYTAVGAQQQSPLLASPNNIGTSGAQPQLGSSTGSPQSGLQHFAQQAPAAGVQQGAQEYFRAAAALYNPADAYQRFMMNRYY